jgi:hypothetical protein
VHDASVRRVTAARTRASAALLAGLLTATALAGCGSNGASSTPARPTRPAPLLSAGSLARLQALAAHATHVVGESFEATWRSTGKGATTIVLAQDPPRQGLEIGDVRVVRTAAHSFFCAGGTCVDEHGVNPLAGVLGLYDGQVLAREVGRLSVRLGSPVGGTRVAFTRDVIGGLGSVCATITVHATSETWCVSARTGITTRWSASRAGFELAAYSATPDGSLLRRPTGT